MSSLGETDPKKTPRTTEAMGKAWNARELVEYCKKAFPSPMTKPVTCPRSQTISQKPSHNYSRKTTRPAVPILKSGDGESAAGAIADYLSQIPVWQNEKKAHQLGFQITHDKDGYTVLLTDGSKLRVEKDGNWSLSDKNDQPIERPKASDVNPTLNDGLLYSNFENYKQLSGSFGTIDFNAEGVLYIETPEGLSQEIRKKPPAIVAGDPLKLSDRRSPETSDRLHVNIPPFSSEWR
jgi:hypothetical protein